MGGKLRLLPTAKPIVATIDYHSGKHVLDFEEPRFRDRLEAVVLTGALVKGEDLVDIYISLLYLKASEKTYNPKRDEYLLLHSLCDISAGVAHVHQGLCLYRADVQNNQLILLVQPVSGVLLQPLEKRLARIDRNIFWPRYEELFQ
ncbi:MAG: hypothetical protein V1837_03445 [Candidatus Woesearchaeota archaeon]